jgi:RND family efflux transporter MFP subunit
MLQCNNCLRSPKVFMPAVTPRARVAALCGSLALGLALTGCDGDAPRAAPAAPPPPQVTVARPVAKTVTEQDEYVGRFVAIDAVEIRARVSGHLEKVHFTDGQLVKNGDLLFTIDRRPFQVELEQARANLAQTKANLAFAVADLARGKDLVGRNVISQQTFDQRTQAKSVAEANVAAQEAAVNQAALNLDFTELRAPVSGRIGDRRVSPGNLVMGGITGTTTLLATIQSIDPIRFEFTADEGAFLRYLRLARNRPDRINDAGRVPVRLKLLDEQIFSHEGRMDFVDNAIDNSSGTIRGRAVFPNPTGTFTPGMFGRIQVAAGPPAEALLVPDAAIGTEQVRKFVLVVDDQNVAQAKYVTLGPLVEGLRVVSSGLEADDRVVVNGLMRARPGTKVTPELSTAAAAIEREAAPAR